MAEELEDDGRRREVRVRLSFGTGFEVCVSLSLDDTGLAVVVGNIGDIGDTSDGREFADAR